MNNQRSNSSPEHFKSLQILDELSNNDSLTQRDLSSRLGIALGLVNTYIKNLITKGYITVKAIPPKRYAYYLTPKGFAEKTRLTYDLLHDYTRIYREARKNLEKLFRELDQEGIRRLVFAGSDEIAEIAYITLQEAELLELAGIVDNEAAGTKFFKKVVVPLAAISNLSYDRILVTSYVKRQTIYEELLAQGVKEKDIKFIFALK